MLRVSEAALTPVLVDDLRAFVARRVAPEDVDDLLQDVLLKVHRGLGSVEDSERLMGWIYRVARNAVTDHHRRRRPHDPLDADAVAAEEAAEDPPARRLAAKWLVATLSDLPERHREALELVELEGLTQRELAARLDLTPSGARTRVQRARAALRDRLLRCCAVELDRRGQVIDLTPRADCDPCGC